MSADLQRLALDVATRHAWLVEVNTHERKRIADLLVSKGIVRAELAELANLLAQTWGAVAGLVPPNATPGGEPPPTFEPFADGHKFAYLPDAQVTALQLGFYTPLINNGGPLLDRFDLAQIPAGSYVGVDAAAEWGEHGPKWGARIHRATGTLRGVEFYRIGDFSRGREGHALYLSPAFGNVLLEDVHAHGCGGHHSHVRSFSAAHDPDGMPSDLLPRPEDTFTWRRCKARHCDAIVAGDSPRASWTIHFANTGSRARLEACEVECDHTARGDGPSSTGALLLGFDQEPRRCPLSETYDFRAKLTRPDRACIFLEGQDESRHEDLDLWETDRAAARVRIVDGCGPVHILRPRRDILLEFVPENDATGAAYREPNRTELLAAGTSHWSFAGVL